jgi:tRNA dimethylallyltransferase
MNNFQETSGLLSKQKTLVVIAGPTAVGKTDLAIKLANHYHTDIVSADSRQFYREMSIGTAKPSEDELAQAKHYFINSHSITDNFNVGDFEKEGLKAIDEIFTHSDVAILAGGSGLYIKAICEGFDDVPAASSEIRDRLNTEYEKNGIEGLKEQLRIADPVYYEEVDTNNPQRIIRALEVIESTGKPFSSYRTANIKQRHFNIIKIGLNLPRKLLYQRINLRVDLMVKQGLIDEVKSLLPHRNLNALNTVGYKEIFEYLDGKTDLDTAISMIKQNTRRFAKRQLTWFNKDKTINWFEPSQLEEIIHLCEQLQMRL